MLTSPKIGLLLAHVWQRFENQIIIVRVISMWEKTNDIATGREEWARAHPISARWVFGFAEIGRVWGGLSGLGFAVLFRPNQCSILLAKCVCLLCIYLARGFAPRLCLGTCALRSLCPPYFQSLAMLLDKAVATELHREIQSLSNVGLHNSEVKVIL